jgi:hypothetical protein
MSSNGQSGKFALFYEKVKRIVTNTTFQWFIGLLVAIVLALMQGKDNGKKDEEPVVPSRTIEHKVTPEYTTKQNQPVIKPPDNKIAPQNHTLIEHQPQFVQEARTNLSIRFQNFDGEEFVSLNIAPAGKSSFTRPILRGYTEEFTSSEGVFTVHMLDIDYNKKRVVIQVNRKL